MDKSWIEKRLEQPEKYPFGFITLTVILFGLLTTSVSNLILTYLGSFFEKVFNISPVNWNIVVAILCLILIFIGLINLPGWVARIIANIQVQSNIQNLDNDGKEITFPGLVVVLSPLNPNNPNPSVAECSINHHWLGGQGNLKHCWLICTDSSLKNIPELIQKLEAKGVAIKEVIKNETIPEEGKRFVNLYYGSEYYLENPPGFRTRNTSQPLSLLLDNQIADDPDEIRRLLDAIYLDVETKSLGDDDVIVDYTAGTKSFTAGIILACAGPNRRLQYISQITQHIVEVITSYQLKPTRRR